MSAGTTGSTCPEKSSTGLPARSTLPGALYGRGSDFPESTRADDRLERRWISLGDNLSHFNTVKNISREIRPENVVHKVNTVLGLAEAVEAGIGVGHLPCFSADARPSLRRLGALKPDYATDLWLLTHPDLRHAPRVHVFLDFLAVELAKRRRFIEGEGVTTHDDPKE